MNQVVKMQTVEPLRAREYTPAQLSLIMKTVAADCNEKEFSLFVEVAKRVGLDPFRRQIHAVVYNKDRPEKRKMSIITGIDGFRAVAARNRDYRPDDTEPEIVFSDEAKNPETNPLGLVKAVVRCFKLGPDGVWHPVVGVAYWDEFAPLKEIWEYSQEEGKKVPSGKFRLDKSSNWFRMGRVMLPKCAEAQAIRKGWPEDLSGIYAQEEMERAQAIDVTAAEAVNMHDMEERQRMIGSRDGIAIWWRAGEPLDMVPVGQLADRAMAFANQCETAIELENWRNTNTVSLRDFWARSKTDALGLKAHIEKRIKELEAK